MLFDYLVIGAMLYGVEIFQWKKQAECERVQQKYIKWCFDLERRTPVYVILEETKRDKIRIRAGQRVMKYEAKNKKR